MNIHGARAKKLAEDLAVADEVFTLEDTPYLHAVLRIAFELEGGNRTFAHRNGELGVRAFGESPIGGT